MKLSTQDTTLELDRGGVEAVSAAAPAPVTAPVAVPAQVEGPAVKAPLVGTFYAAPAPGKDPFVAPGDRVSKGQTLCLIEAMKMMSEVSAPCDCVIEEVLKDNGQLVAFGDALVRYQPC
jgi:acetyl-CoA carboxylase biotin carboxyl carrier protein